MIETEFYTCGLAPFKEPFQFLLLCYEKPEIEIDKATSQQTIREDRRPHIRVIQAHPDTFEEISFDAVTMFSTWSQR